jgi:hypothetical protein
MKNLKLGFYILLLLFCVFCCKGGHKRFSEIEKGDRVRYSGKYGLGGQDETYWLWENKLFSVTIAKEGRSSTWTVPKSEIRWIEKHPYQVSMPNFKAYKTQGMQLLREIKDTESGRAKTEK